MSAGKPPSTHVTKKVRKKSGKKRDVSLTSLVSRRVPAGNQGDRYHSTSFALVMDLNVDDEATRSSEVPMDTSESTRYFPFQLLPELCKLRIWSFLTQCDLGRCMLVCADWHHSIQRPQLWNSVRFSALPYTCLPRDRSGPVHTEPVCHHCFRKRVFSFSQFLSHIHPVVQEFQFCLDISHPTDQFNNVVEQFMSTAELNSLTYADINWKESPSRASLRTSQESLQDYMYRYRKRQRMFCRIFSTFVSVATHLTTLVMPFDWSDKNLECLCSLTKLENLVLEKYGIYNHCFTQDFMNTLTRSLVNLKKLLLEVWIPTCNNTGMEVYYVESASLTFLDVSQCRGFYLKRISTPNLLHLRIARQPWQKSFMQQLSPQLPCMCSVLSAGAPKLQYINGHRLEPDSWQPPTEELTSLMAVICCCLQHKRNNGIEMYGM
ncbi:unnamed protein product [Candidula unifasciata]|uniref:F-box domain-containing protein n=1 Tax=Candidula unifasciata TaxID=100452 RepID=A0A8S3ZD26_9EUPU|nr:unnamed protein product [Candidula unifasciata]